MNRRRQTLKKILAGGTMLSVMPKQWQTPIINKIVLPAHAQTSVPTSSPPAPPTVMCSGFDIEPINDTIAINVTDTQINGPIVVARNGLSFSDNQTFAQGQCTDLDGSSQNQTQQLIFSGQIDSANNQISGELTIRQLCGTTLICEQLSTFSASQTPVNASSDTGDYQGILTGTLRCCRDFF